jgi:hypothetical protein
MNREEVEIGETQGNLKYACIALTQVGMGKWGQSLKLQKNSMVIIIHKHTHYLALSCTAPTKLSMTSWYLLLYIDKK